MAHPFAVFAKEWDARLLRDYQARRCPISCPREKSQGLKGFAVEIPTLAKNARMGHPAAFCRAMIADRGGVGQVRGGASEQQVPHRAFSPIRNDIPFFSGQFGMTLLSFSGQFGMTSTLLFRPIRSENPLRLVRGVGQVRGGANEQQVPHRAFGPVRNDILFPFQADSE